MSQKQVGTFAPISALWNQTGERGTLDVARQFLKWLRNTGQSAWQILPLHPTHLETKSITIHVPSPYKSYGVGLDPKLASIPLTTELNQEHLSKFIQENSYWLLDYSMFCALRDEFKTDDWRNWPTDIRQRTKTAMEFWQIKLKPRINNYHREQCLVHQEFIKFHDLANQFRIDLIGDLPYYLPIQSPLVWANQKAFDLDSDGTMSLVSGFPDTPSAHHGRQLWGHPLYRWQDPQSRTQVVALFKLRLKYLSTLFDSVRLDHARGLFLYGALDPANKDNDSFVPGPGAVVLEELVHFSRRQKLNIFVEDTGENLKELRQAVSKLDVPGIRIFRYALDENHNRIIPIYADIAKYPENLVAYTSTHDTETLMGYLKLLSADQKQLLAQYSGAIYHQDDKIFAVNLRNVIINSPSATVIIPIQDWLMTTHRINLPGTEREIGDQNWKYQLEVPVENLPAS